MKFLVIGLGYISKKHIESIAECGHEVAAICDINNTAGWVDYYFPKAKFYYPEEIQDEYDYVSICTPNYTHLHYINKFTSEIICEKPLVLPSQSDVISKEVNTIMPLRYHDIDINNMGNLTVEYFTYRGDWYDKSWKGDAKKSGGLVCNIGIHLIDLIVYKLGLPKEFKIYTYSRASEVLMNYKDRKVKISLDLKKGFRRSINGIELGDVKNGITKCYHEILAGRGFKTKDVIPTLKLIR